MKKITFILALAVMTLISGCYVGFDRGYGGHYRDRDGGYHHRDRGR